MGHYASEMDTDFGKDNDEIQERRDAGYEWVRRGRGFDYEFYTCGECYALVAHNTWRSHSDWHLRIAS